MRYVLCVAAMFVSDFREAEFGSLRYRMRTDRQAVFA